MLDKVTAMRRLMNRWNEQVEKFPMMREDVPLELYVKRNYHIVCRCELLEAYDKVTG